MVLTPVMSARSSGSSSLCARFGRLLALVLFLAAQIASGTTAQASGPADSPLARLHAAMVLCIGAKHSTPDAPAPLHHHLSDTALAAHSTNAAQPAALLQSEGILPPPSCGVVCARVVPTACGPPARFTGFAYPTGPPDRLI